ncbi:MAG: hypothetical protein HKL98_02865 [Burkholderiales bacterium]|nr:hypothetical protein [Burkholderiales bacterium]
MKYSLRILLAAAAAVSVFGCAEMPGNEPSSIPPKLMIGADNAKVWDHPGAFGPVPADLQAHGDKLCQGIGDKKAIGYHPKAEDENGNLIPGGGYYCSM